MQPAIELKKSIIDRPRETREMTETITKKLNNIEQKINQLTPQNQFDPTTPQQKPAGFDIIHNALLLDTKENIYYCYNCYLNRRWQVVFGDEYTKTCPVCNKPVIIRERKLPKKAINY